MVSLTQLQDVPLGKMILVEGPLGVGKSTFCQEAARQRLAAGNPVIFVTTEYSPYEVETALKKRGLRKIEPGLLSFVDAYRETEGAAASDRPEIVHARCEDLSGVSIAISQLSGRIGKKGILLVFDSLTTPYLFNGSEVLRFMRISLSGFAAEGNAVLASVDEGSCKSEDLMAMMSVADGVIGMAMGQDKQFLEIVKHPKEVPAKIEVTREGVRMKNTLEFFRRNFFTLATSILFVFCLVLPWGLGQGGPIIGQVASTLPNLQTVLQSLSANPNLANVANALTPFVVLIAAVVSVLFGLEAGVIGLLGMVLSVAGSSALSLVFSQAGLGWYFGWVASILCLFRSRLGKLVQKPRSS